MPQAYSAGLQSFLGAGNPRPLGRRGSASAERVLLVLRYGASALCPLFPCYNGAMRKPQARRSSRQGTSAGGYWTGAHTTHRLRFHLVWVPKYRRRVLEKAVAERLTELLHQACEVKAWGLVELNVQPDHVHLLLQVTPCDCIADVMHTLKGGTARVLRAEFPDLEEFLWGESFWADGYFAETVGQQEEARVRDYIRHQRTGPVPPQKAHYKRKRQP